MYPGYYYQPSYYYPPHYFPQTLFPPPPPPPSSDVEHHETSQNAPADTESEQDDGDNKKTKTPAKDSERIQDASTGQFVDGGNYISGGSRDLDVQSSTYKVTGPYNQLERDAPTKSSPPSVPLPKTTYRVISVTGQQVGSDYPLPESYMKAQQVEQLMSQTLANLLPQKTQQQAGQPYEASRGSALADGVEDVSYVNQDTYNPPTYVAAPDATKPAVTYVINGEGTAKVNEKRPSVQASLEDSPIPRTAGKNAKNSNVHYARKPISSSTYAPRGGRDKHQHRDSTISGQTDGYVGYDDSQDYGVNIGRNGEQSYVTYQTQPSSYQSKDPATQTPRLYTYQYSAYGSDQASYAQQDKISSNDGNFGAKQYNKE